MVENLEPLMVVNPVIFNYSRRYIWGNNTESARLFSQLCSRLVGIDGFICDDFKGTTLWNKPVVALNDIEDTSVIIICNSKDACLFDNQINGKFPICNEPIILNPDFIGTRAVIFGAGKVGVQVLHYMKSLKIEIIAFVDSNDNLVGNKIEEVQIEAVPYLLELPAETFIIEAGQYYNEIDSIVLNYIGIENKRFYMYEYLPNDNCIVNVAPGYFLYLYHISSLTGYYKTRRLYVYGNHELALSYINILGLLNFSVNEVKNNVCSAEEKSIEDLVYEKDYLIILVGNDISELIHTMKILGFRYIVDYVLASQLCQLYELSREQLIDLNLGYTYLMDSDYPGISILGSNNIDNYKIAVLGGSTTDEFLSPVRSWVDFFYDNIASDNVTIFNGGIRGYTSTQELIKILRDILNLKPDLIIVYDGVNDATENLNGKPYEFGYLKQMYSIIQSKMNNKGKIYAGNTEKQDYFDSWLNNIELMYAISKCKNIDFVCFLQPMLASKKNKDLNELTIMNDYVVADLNNKRKMERMKNFRQRMVNERVVDSHEFIYDLSHIFDEVNDVYSDPYHVYEKGNMIIANEILSKVKRYFRNI